MKVIEWISDRSNITFLIAVVGFAISIYNFISAIIQNRTRINVDVAHVFRIENAQRCIDIVNLKVLNLSKNPVVLSRITVENDLHSGSLGTYRREVFSKTRRTGGQITDRKVWFSDQLPIKIEGNGCVNLLLVADKEMPLFAKGKKNIINLHTARKTIVRKLLLTDFSENELLEKCREPDC